MPTYEYACRDCGEHLEVVQSFKDDPLTECGLCGGQLRKVFSAAGIIFKGSGYYVTDSRSSAGRDSEGGTSAGTKKSGSTSSSSTNSSSDSGGSSASDSAAKSA
jgi:putative FmdB family regulatory protein